MFNIDNRRACKLDSNYLKKIVIAKGLFMISLRGIQVFGFQGKQNVVNGWTKRLYGRFITGCAFAEKSVAPGTFNIDNGRAFKLDGNYLRKSL